MKQLKRGRTEKVENIYHCPSGLFHNENLEFSIFFYHFGIRVILKFINGESLRKFRREYATSNLLPIKLIKIIIT